MPDIIVVGISNPTCVHDHRTGAKYPDYVKHTYTVRNIGPATASLFVTRISLIFAGKGNDPYVWGLANSPNWTVTNLAALQDAQITISFPLKGFSSYGIEVIANTGSPTMPEMSLSNNNLLQYFQEECSESGALHFYDHYVLSNPACGDTADLGSW